MRWILPGLLGVVLLAAAPGLAAEAPVDPPPDLPDGIFAPLAAPELDPGDRAALEAGDTLVRGLPPTDGRGVGVLTMALVDAPHDRVWAVMADCDGQDEWLPRILHAEVRDRAGDAHTCDLVVDLPFPLDDPSAATRHVVRRLPDGGTQRRWTLLPEESSYERNRGSWTVHPWPGDRSLVVNRMDVLPKTLIPDWILRAAQTRQAPATFEAIRERVCAFGSLEAAAE